MDNLQQTPSLINALYWFTFVGVVSGQGALGVNLLIALRRFRHQGAGAQARWAKMIWASFLVSALGYLSASLLPLPTSLCALIELTLFIWWVTLAARWAAQE